MHTRPAHDDRQPLAIGTVLRQGTVAGVIGFGLRGPVYRVHNTIAPEGIAVREFMPLGLACRTGEVVRARAGHELAFDSARHAFEADAQRATALGTLCMVRSQGLWQERGTSFAAESWMVEPTLAEAVARRGAPLPQADLEAWMRALSDALSPLHRGRGVHGGIAAERVRLRTSGQPLLTGPSTCRRVVAQGHEGDLLAASAYTAPEQLKIGTSLPLGPWTDIYALAALLHLAITGQPPLPAAERMVAERGDMLTPLAGRDYGHGFLRGVDRALSLRPHLRPQSLPQFLGAMGIRERRRQPRGGAGGGLLTNLPLPHVQELDIDLDTLKALGIAH
jgi:hypothetical protein